MNAVADFLVPEFHYQTVRAPHGGRDSSRWEDLGGGASAFYTGVLQITTAGRRRSTKPARLRARTFPFCHHQQAGCRKRRQCCGTPMQSDVGFIAPAGVATDYPRSPARGCALRLRHISSSQRLLRTAVYGLPFSAKAIAEVGTSPENGDFCVLQPYRALRVRRPSCSGRTGNLYVAGSITAAADRRGAGRRLRFDGHHGRRRSISRRCRGLASSDWSKAPMEICGRVRERALRRHSCGCIRRRRLRRRPSHRPFPHGSRVCEASHFAPVRKRRNALTCDISRNRKRVSSPVSIPTRRLGRT